jgi:ribosomal protein S27E
MIVAEKQRLLDEQIPNNTLIVSYKEDQLARTSGELRQYDFYCSNCGEMWKVPWGRASRYKKCPKCAKIRSSMAHQHPEYIQYFVNKNEAYELAAQSNKKVKLKCPKCGAEKEMIVGNLHKRGFSCDVCGTGKSFPERFVASILVGNQIQYETQYSPVWAEGRRYDFYLPDYNLIIETHGVQHYKDANNFYGDVKERQKIDKSKERAAKLHGYKYYVVDCAHSDINYIEESMKTIGLIDALKLVITDEQRLRAYVDDERAYCWQLYNEGKDINYIAKVVHHDIRCVREYLKTGAKLGLCTYRKNRKVAQVDSITGKIEHVFDMAKDASDSLHVPNTTLLRWCYQGGKILYKDKYRIIWLDEYDKYFHQEEDAA